MKAFAILAVGLATGACQPAVRSQATRHVIEVTDAVLVKQSTSQVQEDALRTLLGGTWTCSGVADGINITTVSDFRPNEVLHATLRMTSDQINLNVAVEGRWVVKGFNLQQSFTSMGDFGGTLNGAPVTPEVNAGLKQSIMDLSPDPEAVTISDRKFTLIDGKGTTTTCTR